MFGWIKKIFTKKSILNNNTSGIATIDTSFVYVPKYEELSEDEKECALEDLKILMNDDSYETLLKYSNDLVDISNRERFILSKTLERYYDWFADNKNPLKEKSKEEQLGNSICYGTLANLEFEIIEGKIKEIGEKLKIRAVALDLYVKEKEKEEKKNKRIFQRYFSVANRLEMENFKNRMASEKERIKVSMKINEQILQTIEIDKRDNDTLKNAYELLKVVSDNSIYVDSSFNNMDVKSSLIKLLYRCFYILKNTELYAKFKERIEQFIKQYQDNTTFAYHAPYGSDNFIHKLASPSYLELEHIIPDYMMEEIFKIVASSMHDAEIYCYEHKDEIKEYIESFKKKILEYETTPTKDWDLKQIDQLLIFAHNFKHFSIQKYLHGHCGNEEEEKELEELYTKLKFINIVKGIDIVRYSIVDIGKDMDNDTKNRLVDEILRKIEEKYDTPILDKRGISNKELISNRDYFILYYSHNFPLVLFDFLRGDTDSVQIYQTIYPYSTYADWFTKWIKWARYYTNNGVLDDERLYKNKKNNFNFFINSYNELEDVVTSEDIDKDGKIRITLEDMFYTLKFIGIDEENIIYPNNMTYPKELDMEPSTHEYDAKLPSFLATIKFKELEKNYDDRIVVVPKTISFAQDNGSIKSIDQLQLNENAQAVYLTTQHQIGAIFENRYSNGNTKIKYVFISEFAFEKYKEYYLMKMGLLFYKSPKEAKDLLEEYLNNIFSQFKIIVLPKDTKYSELSSYLDQELEKEEQKKLEKKFKQV